MTLKVVASSGEKNSLHNTGMLLHNRYVIIIVTTAKKCYNFPKKEKKKKQ